VKVRANRFVALGLIALLLMATCGGPAGASIKAEDVWSRPALMMEGSAGASGGGMGEGMGIAGTGAVFMVLKNEGGEPDRLVGGQTGVAEVVEIHETVMEGEVMKMQMLANGLEVPAKGEVPLKPGGSHMMLIGLKRDLVVGDTFSLDLQFEKSGTITVEPKVREP
jgi:copper(I)-binding protein